jgi:hypothetical protein
VAVASSIKTDDLERRSLSLKGHPVDALVLVPGRTLSEPSST